MKNWRAVSRILMAFLVVFVLVLFLTGSIDFTRLKTESWNIIRANLDTLIKGGIGIALGVAGTLIVQSYKNEDE